MSRRDVILQTGLAYQPVLVGLLVLLPSAVAAYMVFIGGNQMIVQNQGASQALSIIFGIASFCIAAIAFSCYMETGERSMRYLIWGLLTTGLEYICRLFVGDVPLNVENVR